MAKWNKGINNDIYNAWTKYRAEGFGARNLLGYTEFETKVKKYAKQKNTSIIDASVAIKDKWTDKAIKSRVIHGYHYDVRKDAKVLDKYGNFTVAARKMYEEAIDADDIDFVNAMLDIKRRKEERTLKSLKASALYNSYTNKKMAQIALMLANAGYTFEMAAASIGCSVADIQNPNNWNGAIFYFNNKAYEFRFSYNDSGEINTSTFIIR